jgi:hypothetical protein
MANKKPNWTSWALRFVGSLVYLAVVWGLWQNGPAVAATGVFAPVLFAIAVVASVSLLLVTLADLGGGAPSGMEWSCKATLLGGFALLGLLPGVAGAWMAWSWVTLVGFVLAYIGIWLGK